MSGAGIDYSGPGATCNRDPANGIRYGVISSHSLGEFALDDVEYDYGKPTCPECGNDVPEYDETKHGEYTLYSRHACSDYACENCEHLLDSESVYSDEPMGWAIDDGDYQIQDCLDSDAMVIKSPYFTYARFCSPCVPGACSLDSPDDDGAKCYALGHDWFDADNPCPYTVYSIETGEQIIMVSQDTTCPNCTGAGRDTVQRLAGVRQSTIEDTREFIRSGAINVRDYDDATGTYLCFRCDGKGFLTEMVERALPSIEQLSAS